MSDSPKHSRFDQDKQQHDKSPRDKSNTRLFIILVAAVLAFGAIFTLVLMRNNANPASTIADRSNQTGQSAGTNSDAASGGNNSGGGTSSSGNQAGGSQGQNQSQSQGQETTRPREWAALSGNCADVTFSEGKGAFLVSQQNTDCDTAQRVAENVGKQMTRESFPSTMSADGFTCTAMPKESGRVYTANVNCTKGRESVGFERRF